MAPALTPPPLSKRGRSVPNRNASAITRRIADSPALKRKNLMPASFDTSDERKRDADDPEVREEEEEVTWRETLCGASQVEGAGPQHLALTRPAAAAGASPGPQRSRLLISAARSRRVPPGVDVVGPAVLCISGSRRAPQTSMPKIAFLPSISGLWSWPRLLSIASLPP